MDSVLSFFNEVKICVRYDRFIELFISEGEVRGWYF